MWSPCPGGGNSLMYDVWSGRCVPVIYELSSIGPAGK
jgi:hypothetical protein